MDSLIPLLNVEDVAESIVFYQRAFDAQVENQWEDAGRIRWARIRFEGGVLMLNTPDGASSEDRRTRPAFREVVLYRTCGDAAAERRRLEESGLSVGPLDEEDYGNLEFGVRDPDGYEIRFSSPA